MTKVFASFVLAAAVLLSIPLSANAAEYDTFVGCDDLSENPVPSHACQLGDFPGAYFESDVDTEYEVCVEFPTEEVACTEEEPAEAGVLNVNSIFSDLAGEHFVFWFVEGTAVGFWDFRLDPPPPPPAPPKAPTVAVPPPIPPAPTKTLACLTAEQRVAKLKNRLRKASGRKQKARLRGKLKGARAATRSSC
jgi:hypothetical protein